MVTNYIGVQSKEVREDGFGNPCIHSHLGFTTSILLTNHIRQFQAEVISKLTSATSFSQKDTIVLFWLKGPKQLRSCWLTSLFWGFKVSQSCQQ